VYCVCAASRMRCRLYSTGFEICALVHTGLTQHAYCCCISPSPTPPFVHSSLYTKNLRTHLPANPEHVSLHTQDTLPPYQIELGLARTIYIRCINGSLGREITRYTVKNGVYVRFWPSLDRVEKALLLVITQLSYSSGGVPKCLHQANPHLANNCTTANDLLTDPPIHAAVPQPWR